MKTEDIERRIIGRLLDATLAAGYCVDVNDGEETTLRRSTSKPDILSAMFTTEADTLLIRRVSNTTYVGAIWLIYGNGEDVISDITVNKEIDALCEFAAWASLTQEA